ncbi:MAG TPA: ferritin-like domain-containing protein [Thermomicrobiales bacterium]|jgi:rubrerythrin
MADRFFKNDVEILNYALTLEHLEADFYVKVINGGKLMGKELADFTAIRDHEVAHVNYLIAGITAAGGTPVKPRASYDFSPLGDINTREGILQIANVLEPTGVGAYDGVAFEIQNKAYLAVAGSIVQIEARHAARIKAIIDPNANPVPNAFEQTLRPADVIAAITPLLGSEQQ